MDKSKKTVYYRIFMWITAEETVDKLDFCKNRRLFGLFMLVERAYGAVLAMFWAAAAAWSTSREARKREWENRTKEDER